uniref:RRM domain-containing protein n=1 Tax=Acrobeloides nanus TaxID=290746 RepID=A0A914DRJ2_9BILA
MTKHNKYSEEGESSEPEHLRKLFIGNLSLNTTEDGLRSFYSQWGDLTDSVIMVDKLTKRSRGFGFITYEKEAQLDDAMANRPHTIDGRTVDPKRAVPRDQLVGAEANLSTKRLYVSGIRESHNEQNLQDYFKGFGNVEKVEIIYDKSTGKPRGFAFVTFDDYDPVDKCVLIRRHQIEGQRCDVKKALTKEQTDKAQQMDRDRAMRAGRSHGVDRNTNAAYGRGQAPYMGGSAYGNGVWSAGIAPWGNSAPYNGPVRAESSLGNAQMYPYYPPTMQVGPYFSGTFQNSENPTPSYGSHPPAYPNK